MQTEREAGRNLGGAAGFQVFQIGRGGSEWGEKISERFLGGAEFSLANATLRSGGTATPGRRISGTHDFSIKFGMRVAR